MRKGIIVFLIMTIYIVAVAETKYQESVENIKEYLRKNCSNEDNSIKSKILNGEIEIIYPVLEFDNPKDKKVLNYYIKDIREVMKYQVDSELDYYIKPFSDFKIFKIEDKEKNRNEIFCYSGNYYDDIMKINGSSSLVLLKNNKVRVEEIYDLDLKGYDTKYNTIIVKEKNIYYVVSLYISSIKECLKIYEYNKNNSEFEELTDESFINEKTLEEKIENYVKSGKLYSMEFIDKDKQKITIDIDGDGKKEKIELESYKETEGTFYLKSIFINNKNITSDEMSGCYYFGFLPYNGKMLLAFGFSDNGVDPIYKLYRYESGKLKKEFDEEFEYLIGIKDNKLVTWWNLVFGDGISDDEKDFKEKYCIYYYNIVTKKWEINEEIIGSWIVNDSKNIFIFSKKEDATTEGDREPEKFNYNEAKNRMQKSNGKIKGILKIREKFKIIKYDYEDRDTYYIESEKGIKGYITGGHMVFH